MRYLVSGKEMKLLDQNTSAHFHVPELVLMEQAAMGFVRKLLSLKEKPGKTLIICGSGNNGADGLAIARLLRERGIDTEVVLAGETASHKTTESYETQKEIITAYGITVHKSIPEQDSYDLVIDALFGTGLTRAVSGGLAQILTQMNKMSGWKVAVDIASGIDADNGSVPGSAFAADDTITFSYGKAGQYLWPGNEYSGRIHIVPIGITDESWLSKKPRIVAFERSDLGMLPERNAHSNKGTYGKLLLIAGSVNMAGAACMAAKAAYRSGCGLVKVFTAEENRQILQSTVPEAILATYSHKLDEQMVIDELKWADAVVLGPGIGMGAAAEKIVKLVLKNCAVPLLLDADALNIIARQPDILMRPHTDIIVTPHLGEMARLTGDTVALIQTRLLECAGEFAQNYDVICVLKDFHTVTAIPYGHSYLNLSGNHGMATAGSGDVLAGIIGSFLSQRVKSEHAAALGVYLHGLAGDLKSEHLGTRSLMASDIIEGLSLVLGEWEEEEHG